MQGSSKGWMESNFDSGIDQPNSPGGGSSAKKTSDRWANSDPRSGGGEEGAFDEEKSYKVYVERESGLRPSGGGGKGNLFASGRASSNTPKSPKIGEAAVGSTSMLASKPASKGIFQRLGNFLSPEGSPEAHGQAGGAKALKKSPQGTLQGKGRGVEMQESSFEPDETAPAPDRVVEWQAGAKKGPRTMLRPGQGRDMEGGFVEDESDEEEEDESKVDMTDPINRAVAMNKRRKREAMAEDIEDRALAFGQRSPIPFCLRGNPASKRRGKDGIE